MLGLTEVDLKQTRFYQEVFAEGRWEEGVEMVLRQMRQRFGGLEMELVGLYPSVHIPPARSVIEF